jgi:hypothetical protein
MPLYRITAPNGQTYQIEGPEGASDAEVARAVMAQYPDAGAAPKQSTVGSELKRGAQQVASSMQTAFGALTGSPEEAAKAGVERGQAISQAAGEGVGFEPVKKAFQEKGLLSAAGEAVSQIPRALAGQGANLATMAGGARLGATAGSLFGPAGTVVGGALGAGAAVLPQFFGSNVERQAAEQMEKGEPVKIDRTKAGLAAAGQAALEGAGTAFTLGKGVVKGVLGVADDAALTSARAAKELEATARRSLAASVGRGAARGAVVEMPVEIAQQVVERAQAGLDLTSREALAEYGDAAYQAGLIGGPLGGAGNVVTRGQAQQKLEEKARAEAAAKQAEIEARGPQLTPEAPAGAQGEMFGEAEMGVGQAPKPEAPAVAPSATPAAEPASTQTDLGLDYQREFADLIKERERLLAQPQTPEVKARADELTDQMRSFIEMDIAERQAQAEQDAEAKRQDELARLKFPALTNAPDLLTQPDEVKARTQGELFPGEDLGAAPTAEPIAEPTLRSKKEQGPKQMPLGLRRNPEGQPTTFGEPEPTITSADIMLTAIPVPKGVEGWLLQNVVGSTPTQLEALITKDPTLVQGNTPRAKILRALTAKQVPAFEEAPRAKTPTPTPAVEQRAEPGTSEPSVGVPSEPEPAPARAAAPAEPVTPDGRGLVPAGQPAVQGTEAQGAEPAAVIERTADTVHGEVRELVAEQQKLLTKAGRIPAVNSPARAKWDALDEQIAQKTAERDELGRKERKAKAPQPPAPAAKPAPAPEPQVTAEVDAEEAARKAEAEDMKRRLEALEKAQRAPTPPAIKQEAPKVEKAEPSKPIPEKLYEPVGTSEFGMEEGEKEILRGPQAMLFPMSKREELEYAERPRAEQEAEAEPTAIKDERQGELDLRAPRKAAAKKPKPVIAAAPKVSASTTWAAKHAIGSQQIVYEDSEVALVRAVNAYGEVKYFAMDDSGNQALNSLDSRSQPSWLTAEQKQRLSAAMADAQINEKALADSTPDGPFTGAAGNVVATDSLDPGVGKYAAELLKSIGLGDLRVFIYTSADLNAEGSVDKYKLYGPYAKPARYRKDSLNGAATTFGPSDDGTFAIYLKGGMSEGKTLEILSHEIGHIVEETAYENADPAVRKAIQDEYMAWRKEARKATAGDLMHMLRNREDAESNVELLKKAGSVDTPATQALTNVENYWTSFGEWFADNVSRWATTNEKPLSITEKFFSKLAQKMRDLVAIVTGRKYPPAKSVADFLNAAGPADFRPNEVATPDAQNEVREQFSVSVSTESLIDSMGPLENEEKPLVKRVIDGFKAGSSPAEPAYATKFRTQTADAAATIEHRLREKFDGAVRDSLGKLNPMGLYRQAQDHAKLLLEFFQQGSLVKDKTTGLWRVDTTKGVRPPAEVYALIDKWGEKHGYDRERATQIASRILEGVRLDAMRTSNKTEGTEFLLHMKDNEIDQLVREYKADPDLQAMSKLMDEARLAMVDNMVAVGRLSPEQGKAWKEAAGYVPFDRIEDFAERFSKVKKISNKGLAQIGKLPELVGSLERPVGNVFDNYLNTLGWMVGQTMKTDASVQTLRSLEDIGQAKFLGRSALGKDNTVGMYVDGEMMYWELPSKYDLLAFKDLNPPKAGWLRNLGAFSNVLRKSVTVLPPFALKQVTDDVQRAILTSGVRSPGALLRMSLTNFPKLALAELRGIQHPMVREFGALGLTGEYDFQAGKPATSLLKDLGYKKRGKFETLLHRLDGITRASDLSVRKAIYDQTMKETGDQLLAQTRAREFINFRRRGASDFVGAMVTVIPFFNAYIQGMDVLYRAASGKDSSSSVDRAQARRLFWSRASTVMMLSSLYALGKDDDDEDYKEMDLRVRDGNWILPGGYKIPVPGELGAIFKVIPERVVEYMKRQGTPEEQDAWEATRTALTYMYEQYIGRATPVPQAIKPVLEAWSNKSFLTGRPLEGFHHQQMEPSMRKTDQTSELAIAIANFSRDAVGVQVSPIMVDNALRGYFGSTAALLTATTDSLLNPTRIDRPLHKWALVSNYMYDPVGTRRMTEFYEEREKVGKAGATLRELLKTDMDRAATYAEEHAEELQLEGAINATLQQLEDTRAYRKFLNSKDGAESMSAAEREEALKEIKQMEIGFTGWLREAKAAMRQ